MTFSNRQQAGSLLAERITEFLDAHPEVEKSQVIVLALPRGGVPVAVEIALALSSPLDVIASKKIGAPDQPELAIGAVTSDGVVVVDEVLTDCLHIPPVYVEHERHYLVAKTKQLEEIWRSSAGITNDAFTERKMAIVVDDGVATGMTAIAAARSLKKRGFTYLILAAPVMSSSAYSRLLSEYDHIVVLDIPSEFASVGQFYLDFRQTSDMEVVRALAQARNSSRIKAGAF